MTPVAACLLAAAAAACGPEDGDPGAASTGSDVAEAVRDSVTAEGLARSLDSIVQYDRRSGTEGEDRAIDFVARELRSEGIPTRIDTFRAYVSDPVSASLEVPASAGFSPEALTVSFSAPAEGLQAPVVDVGTPEDLPELALATGERLLLERPTAVPGGVPAGGRVPAGDVSWRACPEAPDLRGKIALIEGLPIPETAWKLERLGAAGAVFVNPEDRLNALIVSTLWGGPSLRNQHRIPALPLVEVTRSAGQRLREMLRQEGELTVRLTADVRTRWKELRLVQAAIPPANAEASFVLFGGHIDSWWQGATDEAASNAAMLELTRAFWAQRDRLRRGLVVAWWPGHSNARYAGSKWYADRRFHELRERAVAYLNVDGIGQRDAATFDAAA
ncbi:MAG: M28 family peptidase, partial [Gemmatimonadota bacterium]